MREIRQAILRARLGEMVGQLPEGMHTEIGERGAMLSGGQRQRIAIARIFLKNPPILILDEATSALDSETERLIQRSLTELAAGRTTLVIAHRLATVRNADRIVVLSPEGVLEQGSHATLLARPAHTGACTTRSSDWTPPSDGARWPAAGEAAVGGGDDRARGRHGEPGHLDRQHRAPHHRVDVHASPAASVWVVNAYQLALIAALLPLSTLGEIYGFRRVYMAGLGVHDRLAVLRAELVAAEPDGGPRAAGPGGGGDHERQHGVDPLHLPGQAARPWRRLQRHGGRRQHRGRPERRRRDPLGRGLADAVRHQRAGGGGGPAAGGAHAARDAALRAPVRCDQRRAERDVLRRS